MTGLSFMLLAVMVSGFGINPIAANWSRTIVTTQVHFGIHRRFTWKDGRGLPFWKQWRRFHVLKAGTVATNQSLFWVLVSLLEVHYTVAYFLCVTLMGIANFGLSQKFIFGGKDEISPA
jgi:putative flippase GtrA